MCLGVPGQVVELLPEHPHLAKVEVGGVRRNVNVGLLVDEGVAPGEWVLIHVGFAMAKIDEEEAGLTLESLRQMGQDFDDELRAIEASDIG